MDKANFKFSIATLLVVARTGINNEHTDSTDINSENIL